MNNDIIPPRPPRQVNDVQPPAAPAPQSPPEVNLAAPQEPLPATPAAQDPVASPQQSPTVDAADAPHEETVPSPKKHFIKWLLISITTVVLLCFALLAWYIMALRPVSSDEAQRVNVAIISGSSPSQIGELLQEKKVIRSKTAFAIYTRIHNVRNKLQAGSFSLSPADSTSQIVDSLTSGEAEQFDITFYPGATLNIASTSADKTPSHRQVLQKLGYSDDEITEAFNTSYVADYPLLFSGKPESADLEGYIYGQTYKMASGSSVKQILMRTFDEFEAQIKENKLVEAYQARNLSLYQGITLASIIQREVPNDADQKQVAQIFFTRLNSGMMLGSDVTYHYAADKAGVARDHTLDSPYNTRKYAGLPPGPIASPGISSLLAVASPAPGDYVYFLSGDDHKTYYAHTNEEHEANIVNHCAFKCSLP
jgi:UPF0755 protein